MVAVESLFINTISRVANFLAKRISYYHKRKRDEDQIIENRVYIDILIKKLTDISSGNYKEIKDLLMNLSYDCYETIESPSRKKLAIDKRIGKKLSSLTDKNFAVLDFEYENVKNLIQEIRNDFIKRNKGDWPIYD